MNFALSILTGLLLILAFPKFDYTFLAPFALAPLLFAMAREPRPKRRFLYGWCAGVVYWFGVCYWIRWVLLEYGGLGPISSWGAFLLFALAKGLHMAVFAALAGLLMNRWWAIPAVAALWTGIERTHAPLGFAWLALGNAASDMGIPMRLAPIFGVYGVSFVLAIMSVALAAVLLKQPRNRLFWLAVLPALYLLPALPPPEPPRETAVAVQPNIDEHNEWTSLAADELHQRLASLSLKAALAPGAPPASMILWPEAPAPIYYDSNPTLREHIATLARTTGVPVLFGTVGHTEKGQPLNSAMMVLPSGQPDGRYDKVHLVPFGEFIPPLFGFVTRITQEAGDFVPGDRVVVFPNRVGAFICYESVFPHFVREFPRDGAQVLVNLSNDGYFGRTAARWQHLKIVRMRAAENRRWILRATNDGITVSIDPAGRLVDLLPPFTEQARRLGFSYVETVTAYTRWGDWFAWLCLAAGLAACVATQVPHYRPPVTGSKS